MVILVTGGTGYIGSHTIVELVQRGHKVVAMDNLCNSQAEVIDAIEAVTGVRVPLVVADVADAAALDEVFRAHRFDGVIHFAGLKAVGESVQVPLNYYANNLMTTIRLAQACVAHGVQHLVFSSSATVYGDQLTPYREDMALLPRANPYGETKAMCEKILTDAAHAHAGLAVTLLRYFNPVGAHPSGELGERPNGVPNNLMPYLLQVASGERAQLTIFGDDYPTPDGTGVRDYIHVVDLALGHVAAIEHAVAGGQVNVYNLGTGRGTSVRELVQTFEAVNGVHIPCQIGPRRAGDLASYYADASKAERELGWTATRGIAEMCRDGYRFINKN